METLVDLGLRNAALAIPLCFLAVIGGIVIRRPAILHVLWVLVLLRLVMPALWNVTVPCLLTFETAPVVASAPDRSPQPSLVSNAEKSQPAAAGIDLSITKALAEDDLPNLPAEILPPKSSVSQAIAPTPIPPDSVELDPGFEERGWALEQLPNWLPSWRMKVALAWLLASSAVGLLMLIRLTRFAWALRHSRLASDAIQFQAERVGRSLGLRRIPRVVLVNARISPMLYGFIGRPRLVVPALLWQKLGLSQRSALLAHELAHYRRGDHWVRALEMLAGVLFWWHPVLWLAKRQLREMEEQCCDAWVVWALPHRRRDYATALVDTVGFLSEGRTNLPALASGVGRVRHLKRRVTMIMQGTTPRQMPRLLLVMLFATGLAFATLGTTWGDDRFQQEPRQQRGDDQRVPDEPAPRPRQDARPQPSDRPAETALPGNQDAVRRELEQARADFERARRRLDELERRFGLPRDGQRRDERNAHAGRDAVPPDGRLPESGRTSRNDPLLPRVPALPRGDEPPADRFGRNPQPGMPGGPGVDRASLEQRMQMMERQLHEMLRQMEEMRRAMEMGGRGPNDPTRQPPGGPDRGLENGRRPGRTADPNAGRGAGNVDPERPDPIDPRDHSGDRLGR